LENAVSPSVLSNMAIVWGALLGVLLGVQVYSHHRSPEHVLTALARFSLKVPSFWAT